MTQVRVTPPSNMKWVGLAVLAAVAAGVAWWKLSADEQTEPAPVSVSEAASDAVSAASQQEDAGSNIADFVPGATSPAVVVAQQQEAVKAVEMQPDIKPIVGPVSERPAFVSPMEWTLLQAAAQQQPDPEKKLVDMLNFMRFVKQSEALDAMPKPGEPGKRRALADSLVNDLPPRLLNGDMDLNGAKGELVKLLEDAEPDAKRREKRLEAEMKRLTAADEQARMNEAKPGTGAPAEP